jgi:hypothetical protein
LISIAKDLEAWCQKLGAKGVEEFGYDGFSNSFRKSHLAGVADGLKIKLASISQYEYFIKKHMQR